jgi:C-terminal processing protease CtpA/Prc
VTSVFEGSQPERQGILVGDEIVSINGAKISELPAGIFCEIYRNEYDIFSKADSISSIEIMKNGNLMKYKFNRQNIFD